jgi:transcriptional regulator with XRE-family HTH domain
MRVTSLAEMEWAWRDAGAGALDKAISRAGKTYASLADEMGVDDSTISRWCSGTRTPNATQLAALCRAVPVSADELLGLPVRLPGDIADRLNLLQRTLEPLLQSVQAAKEAVQRIRG